MLWRRIWKAVARLYAINITETGICASVRRAFAIAADALLNLLKTPSAEEIPLTMTEKILIIAARTDGLTGNIIRIEREIGETTQGTFKAAGDTGVITREISGATVKMDTIIEEITGVTGITGTTTEKASGVTVETDTFNEKISGIIADSGLFIEGIYERIVKLDGITNDIIPRN